MTIVKEPVPCRLKIAEKFIEQLCHSNILCSYKKNKTDNLNNSGMHIEYIGENLDGLNVKARIVIAMYR